MKVSEAKTKVCPFMNVNANEFTVKEQQNCICSDCMAWGYLNTHDENYTELSEDEKEGYCRRLEND